MHHWMWYELKKVEVLQNALEVIISFRMPAYLIYAHNCEGSNGVSEWNPPHESKDIVEAE